MGDIVVVTQRHSGRFVVRLTIDSVPAVHGCAARVCAMGAPYLCDVTCLLSPSRQTRHSHCAPLCFAVCDHRDVHSLKVKSCGHFRLPHPMSFTRSIGNDR